MKIFRTIAFLSSLFFFLATPVFAQFTLLPKADEHVDCDYMLDQYEITGEIPTEGERTAHEARKSADNYNALSSAGASYSSDLDELCNAGTDDICKEDNIDNATKELCATAQDSTCKENEQAKAAKEQAAADLPEAKQQMEADQSFANANAENSFQDRDNLLGCAIKTGRISFQMAPYFITYVSDFVLSLIGLVSVLFIVLGGYYYIYGGLTDQKEKGKKTIQHALMGMSLAILAWVIVGAIMSIVTGA